MLAYPSMFGKILLTVVVILGAYLVIRARLRHDREPVAAPPSRPLVPLIPSEILKTIAYGLVAVMVAGSLLWLYLDYQSGREVVRVRIINATTGSVTTYEARRADVQDRRFITLDGRPVTLADVDRMELSAGR